MRNGLHQLSDVLRALTEQLDLEKGLEAQRAVAQFAAIVGPAISSHAWAEGIRGDTLLLVTDSPVWSHQLQMLEPELVAKLRTALGEGCPVARLRFRSGSRRRAFDPPAGTRPGASDSDAAADVPPRLTRRDWHDIRLAAEQAADADIARALAGALRAQIAPPAAVPSAGPKSQLSSAETSNVEGDSPPVI